MALPVFTAGQILTAALVNSWLEPLVAYKASDESVASSTTLQNDNDLFLSVAANAVYDFSAFITYTGGTLGTSDIKMGWTVPAGLTMKYGVSFVDTTGNATMSITRTQTDNPTAGSSAGSERWLMMTGTVVVAATAGTLQFQWAQNTSNATATVVQDGSWISLQRIA